MRLSKWRRVLLSGSFAVSGWMLTSLGACTGDAAQMFRAAAADDLQSGILSILTGVVDGTFAVINPAPSSTSN